LISGLLFREWIQTGTFNIRRFYARRALKIYPGFYAMLALTLLIDRFIIPGIPSYPITRTRLLAELTFTQNYLGSIWGQTWSLAVEEHFYLLLPLLLWCMHKRNTSRPFQCLPTVFLCVSVGELILRLLIGWNLSNVTDEPRYGMATHLRTDGLIFGVALRYLYDFERAKFRQYARSNAGTFLSVLGVFGAAVIGLPNPVMHTFGYTFLSLGFGLLLCRVVDASPNRLLAPLARLGYYSYSIYLWHAWACRLLPRKTPVEYAIAFLAAIVPGIIAAHLVEQPVLALRDRLYPSRFNDAVVVAHAA
jgi:peptidoglycan/LPS O-acetylase OafA/YrhL